MFPHTATTWPSLANALRAFDLLDELIDERRPHRFDLDLDVQDEQITLTALIPGLQPESIQLDVQGDQLRIAAERREQQAENARVLRKERHDYSLDRSFALPYAVDPEHTQASYHNGILRIVLPREASSKPRRISVSNQPLALEGQQPQDEA